MLNLALLQALLRLLKLVRLHQRDDSINLHQHFLLLSQQLVRSCLFLDPLRELLPVQVANQLLKLVLVNFVQTAQCVHIELNQVIVRD